MSGVAEEVSGRAWDRGDQRLVAALECDARVSAERAGSVLGVGPRHVQRRWAAMLEEGSVRLVTETVPAPGDLSCLWRWTPSPAGPRGGAPVLLAALAGRGDVDDVRVSAAGEEVAARASGGPEGLAALTGLAGAGSTRSAVVLHRYADAADRRLDVLTDAERSALTPPAAPARGPERTADADDAAVVAVLRRAPRASAVTVAAACGLPASTARRRLASLLRSGLVRTRVHPDTTRLGIRAPAHLHLQLPPGRVDAAARALTGHRAVHEVLAVTGPSPLRVLVAARDVEHLHVLLTRDLPALTGDAVTGVETVLLAP